MRQQKLDNKTTFPSKPKSFSLDNYLNHEQLNKKITCLPLDFQYIPVQILSKEFTKLNNPHPYRIHYLGPRYKNTLEIHKKNSFSEKRPHVYNSLLLGDYLNVGEQKGVHNKQQVSNFMQQQFSSQSDSKLSAQKSAQEGLKTVSQNIKHSENLVEKYKVDMRKIAHSFLLQEKLKNSQFFKQSVYYRAFEGMNPTLNLSQQVIFNSCFEGGNLDCVIKLNESQFDLFLKIDSNTRGHLLWFYFSVKNQQKLGKLTMNICNFSKSKTLYKEGLRPYVFSSIKNKLQNRGWQQSGTNLGLQKRQLRYELLQGKSNNSNCLTIEYDFEHENDEVFFAYCIPYTYSQLINDINQLPEKYVEKRVLGKSLLGTDIPILHITEPCEQNRQKPSKQQVQSTTSNIISDNDQLHTITSQQKKRAIFVTGRIHPSESNSSYVIMGFIRWLCSDDKQATQLRKIARFIIIPMVNPDGVIIGNSRTSASGKDLNRQYINPDPTLHPQICLIKEISKKIHSQQEITLFLDFHGHSRKKNTFFYGPVYSISQPNYYKCRILPKLIQKISNPFRYHSCSFSLIEDKKKTARASMFQSLGIEYTYTVESSIGYFYDSQQLKIMEFSQLQWFKMGAAIAQGTSNFIVGIDSYEQFLTEKRKERLRRKKFFRNPNTKVDYLEDNVFLENQNAEESLKLNYEEKHALRSKSPQKCRKSNTFMQILEQIRKSSPKKSNQKPLTNQKTNPGRYIELDIDQDSDSHDQNQDMDTKRLKQFAFIVKHQLKSLNSLDDELNNKQIKLHYQNELRKKTKNKTSKVKKTKVINEFDLLNDEEKEEKMNLRSTKTGDEIRNKLVKHNQPHHSDQHQFTKEKTLPEELNQNNSPHHDEGFMNKFQTTLTKLTEKRQIYTSAKRDKKSIENAEKREKTIGNYFGEYRLMLDGDNVDNQKKKEKYDIIRKLQSRRQHSRKKRAESSNEIKANFQHCSSLTNQNSTFCRKKKPINPPEIIHGPTEFTFSIPFTQNTETSSKSYILKPKLKLNIKQKPHSVQHFQTSLNIKQRDNSCNMTMKQKSQKMIQGYFHSQKQSQKDKKVSQSYLIQHAAAPFFNRMSQGTEKSTSKDINRSTRIDLNDVKNTVLINTFKVYQM